MTGKITGSCMYARKGSDAVLGFKAPHTGKLRIYLRHGINSGSNGFFKILHNNQRIYPINSEWYTIDDESLSPPLLTGNINNYNTEWPDGVAVDVNKDDMIYIVHSSGELESSCLINYFRGFEYRYIDYIPEKYISINVSDIDKVGDVSQIEVDTDCETVSYSSSNPLVTTVDSEGKITAVSAGMCDIYAIGDNLVADKISLRIMRELSAKNVSYAVTGDKIKLSAVYSDGGEAYAKWSSADEDIAYIDNGVLYARSKGKTELTAQSGYYTYSMPLEVYELIEEPIFSNENGIIKIQINGDLEAFDATDAFAAIKNKNELKRIHSGNINTDEHRCYIDFENILVDNDEYIELFVFENMKPLTGKYVFDKQGIRN